MKARPIATYLNNHLAGAAAALSLLQKLTDSQKVPEDRRFYTSLLAEITRDKESLEDLLKRLGEDTGTMRQLLGNLSGRASQLGLVGEGLDPGDLGLFEALEILVIGISGKCLLWKILSAVSADYPAWSGVDFPALEARAIDQRALVETRRMQAGAEALAAAITR